MKKSRIKLRGRLLRAPQSSSREHWMDALRGIAIVLVIVGHAYGFAAEELAENNSFLHFTVEMIAPFRIPAMVFLSGLLVPGSLAKGRSVYLIGKSRTILYPYFVWSAIMLIVLIGASAVTDRGFDSGYFLRVLYQPIEHVWFLGYLFVYYLLALVLQRIPSVLPAAAFLILSAVPDWTEGTKFLFLAGFFFLGILAAQHRSTWMSLVGRFPVAIACLAVGVGVFAATASNGATERYSAWFAPFVLLSIIGAAGVLLRLSQTRQLALLRYIGVRSIIFYLLHWPVILILNELIAKALPISIVPLVLVATVAAIAVSFLFCSLVERFSVVGLLFSLPRPKGLTAASPTGAAR